MKEMSPYFGKITGTNVAAILGENKHMSPFQAWARMTGLVTQETDNEATKAGQVIEGKLRDYHAKQVGHGYKGIDPATIDYDEFKGDQVFGGLIDAHPVNAKGEIDYNEGFPMLEIKTSSEDRFQWDKLPTGEMKMVKDASGKPIVVKPGNKKLEWLNKETGKFDNIPIHYQHQLALYMGLKGQSKGRFVVGFLKPEHYVDPEGFTPDESNTVTADFNLDVDKYRNTMLPYLRNWHETHVQGGISPEMTDEDLQWFNANVSKKH